MLRRTNERPGPNICRTEVCPDIRGSMKSRANQDERSNTNGVVHFECVGSGGLPWHSQGAGGDPGVGALTASHSSMAATMPPDVAGIAAHS